MEFIELTREEFSKIQNKFPNSTFYQTIEWANIKEQNDWQTSFLGVKKQDKIIAACLLLSKKILYTEKLYYSPRGFLIDYHDKELLDFFINNIIKYIKQRNGFALKIDPLIEYVHHDNQGNIIEDNFNNQKIIDYLKDKGFIHYGFSKGYTKEAQFRWSYCLNISQTEEQLFANMNQRCRRCIRKSEKYPLISIDVDEHNIDDFMNIMKHTAKRQKHAERSPEYYLNLKKYLKERLLLKVIYLDKNKYLENFKDDKLYELIKQEKKDLIPISAGGFIFDNDKLNYVYGGTYSHYMGLMAQYKMQIDMIRLAKEKKLSFYDFGGISGIFEKDTPNYGVYEFKKGFGGYVVEYIGEFDYIIYKVLYRLYNEAYDKYRQSKQIINESIFHKNK